MHKIMVVDDEVIITSQLEKRLIKMGYEVVGSASSGEDAVDMARRLRPDLILMDIVMPGKLDGIEAAEIIVAEMDISVIFLTAYANDEFIKRAKSVEPFGYIVKPFRDTELRAVIEVALYKKEMERKLHASELRYRTLFDNSPMGVSLVTIEGEILECNDAMLLMTGYSEAEFRQVNLMDTYQNPEEHTMLLKRLQTEGVVRDMEVEWKRKDGSPFYACLTLTPFTLGDGDVFLIVAQDITVRKRAEEELEAHREHIKLINKILRHDIINDLSVINSALRLYGRSKKKELLEEVSARVNKSVELINRMRDLEIFISAHRGLKSYSFTEVLKKVLVSYPAIAFNIEGECQVLADDSLDSAIDNIIRNAVDHGKTDRIDIKIVGRGEYCEIRIADYGVGIPDELKAKIFGEGFVYGETGGTGLGLCIVKNAMETYGGHVRIEDNRPRGAVFVLTLKRVR